MPLPRVEYGDIPESSRSNRSAARSHTIVLFATGVVLVTLVMWFGAMSASASHLSRPQAAVSVDQSGGNLPLESASTPTTIGASIPASSTVTSTGTVSNTPTTVPAADCPPAGCPLTLTPTGVWQTDQVWYGQTPAGGGLNLPVLVFVPGLTNIAQDWWTESTSSGVNDMYHLAYVAGYRTAFPTLNQGGDRGNDENEYVNGNTLAQQITAIVNHYQVAKVVLITHSKGGIDAQDAIATQVIGPKISMVLMLSAPNLGSQLASIACTPSATTLSAICAMTPPLMSVFRQTMDFKLENSGIPFYVAGGTDHGDPGTALYLGGSYLSQWGSSDGFVTVSSALGLPNARYMFVRSYNHDTIRIGHNSFPYIDAILRQGIPQTPGPPVPTLMPTAIH
jgi:hypothetical protein